MTKQRKMYFPAELGSVRYASEGVRKQYDMSKGGLNSVIQNV